MLKKIILILFLTILSCSNIQHSEKNLEGNWFSYGSFDQMDLSIDYTELFFYKDTIYSSYEYTGMLSPRKYIISNDSVFFHPKNDPNFIGMILMKSKDSFWLGIDEFNKRSYYRINDSINLENVLNKRTTEEIYYAKFRERLNVIIEKFNLE